MEVEYGLSKRPKLLSLKHKQTKQILWHSCWCYLLLFNDGAFEFPNHEEAFGIFPLMQCGLEPQFSCFPEVLSLVNGFVYCHLSDLNVTSEAETTKRTLPSFLALPMEA